MAFRGGEAAKYAEDNLNNLPAGCPYPRLRDGWQGPESLVPFGFRQHRGLDPVGWHRPKKYPAPMAQRGWAKHARRAPASVVNSDGVTVGDIADIGDFLSAADGSAADGGDIGDLGDIGDGGDISDLSDEPELEVRNSDEPQTPQRRIIQAPVGMSRERQAELAMENAETVLTRAITAIIQTATLAEKMRFVANIRDVQRQEGEHDYTVRESQLMHVLTTSLARRGDHGAAA